MATERAPECANTRNICLDMVDHFSGGSAPTLLALVIQTSRAEEQNRSQGKSGPKGVAL